MGSFYTNLHARTADREAVMQAWQSFWDERGESSRAWVSPAYGRWISLFDWRSDQQDADSLSDLAAHLSRMIDGLVLTFQVQDSEVAEYRLFNHGTEVDHYVSNTAYTPQAVRAEGGVFAGYGPDTGGGYPEDEDATDGGNAGLLKSLTHTSANEMELEAILRTPAIIADDILTALAGVVGINDIWASVGYHYLVREGDTIPGMDGFQHLPPDTPPDSRGLDNDYVP